MGAFNTERAVETARLAYIPVHAELVEAFVQDAEWNDFL
jgi:hypothetical protein